MNVNAKLKLKLQVTSRSRARTFAVVMEKLGKAGYSFSYSNRKKAIYVPFNHDYEKQYLLSQLLFSEVADKELSAEVIVTEDMK
ncbi:MAG: hypothetical protein LBN93_10515 [Candidatus Symbiothrix sp.]|jgi:hypothetical protein|nr:hypothetical protein [Candidatus Symbiothrix sp.]